MPAPNPNEGWDLDRILRPEEQLEIVMSAVGNDLPDIQASLDEIRESTRTVEEKLDDAWDLIDDHAEDVYWEESFETIIAELNEDTQDKPVYWEFSPISSICMYLSARFGLYRRKESLKNSVRGIGHALGKDLEPPAIIRED